MKILVGVRCQARDFANPPSLDLARPLMKAVCGRGAD